jgi:DNA segregation ATPase FtsK/SpoIIIE-like protein
VARKGRAFGVSVIIGTQYPTSDVIDRQIKANLTAAVAFRTRTGTESRVIIDRNGAEELTRPGQALAYIGGAWRRLQALRAGDMADLIELEPTTGPALDDTEAALVRYALEELRGAFTISKLYDAHSEAISKHALTKLAKRWERRGWLSEPEHAAAPRYVTAELEALVSPPLTQDAPGRDT